MKLIQLCLGTVAIAAMSFTACNDPKATTDTETDAMLVNTSAAKPGATAATPATVLTSTAGNPQNTPTQATPQGSAQTGKTAAALNPAHGQPGHRCDIAVGAPLDAPANPAQSMPVNIQQGPAPTTISTQPAAPANGAATGKLNPPHGQPGHDCAKPVGAPL